MRKIASLRIPRGKWSSPYPNKVCLESSKSTEKVHLVASHRLSEITSFLDFGVCEMFPFFLLRGLGSTKLVPVRRQHLHQTRRVQGLLQGRGNNPHLGHSPTPQDRGKGLRCTLDRVRKSAGGGPLVALQLVQLLQLVSLNFFPFEKTICKRGDFPDHQAIRKLTIQSTKLSNTL